MLSLLSASSFVIAEMLPTIRMDDADKRDLACRVLPRRIRISNAKRFAWLMPILPWLRSVPLLKTRIAPAFGLIKRFATSHFR